MSYLHVLRLASGLLMLVMAASLAVAEDPPRETAPTEKTIPAIKLVPAKKIVPATKLVPVQRVPDQATLEKRFIKLLTGASLVGRFTTEGVTPNPHLGPPQDRELYEISKVAKAPDGQWMLLTRLKFGDVDVKVPVKVPVEWAGDTPVITLTDFGLPGLGTFTSRVVLYRNRYAGTWQHGDKGGHLFGRIVRTEDYKKGREVAEEK